MADSSSQPDNPIAFVTTCKGRRHHLERTLPPIVAEAPGEIVVVDFDCPQKSADWAEANFPGVKAVRVTGRPEFHLAQARNIGAHATAAPWICFVDADSVISPGFVGWMRRNLREGHFYTQDPAGKSLEALSEGVVVCHRRAFAFVEGYDETIRGWGAEDTDFYDRLALCNVANVYFPSGLVSSLPHGEDERMRFYAVKNRQAQQMLNRTYRIAKHQVMHIMGIKTELAADMRQKLYDQIEAAFAGWITDPSRPLPSVKISVAAHDSLREPHKIFKQCTFTLSLQ
ncbi:MAG TPA: glycosyltransferase family 2 protein [Rhizomicrobium sp.]|nr:glycosyltransferase family 2 protein [Rhizomicrobium sp.]